jgi:uncharacterized protein involved in exopolysaccharide biosynthesis
MWLLSVTVSTGAAVATSLWRDPLYAARSEVVFDVRALGWDIADRMLATEVLVARSHRILDGVAQRRNLPITLIERGLIVETMPNSAVIRLEFNSSDAEEALGVTLLATELYVAASREFTQSAESIGPRILTPAFVLESPVWVGPLRAAAIGAGVGLTLAAAATALVTGRRWRL